MSINIDKNGHINLFNKEIKYSLISITLYNYLVKFPYIGIPTIVAFLFQNNIVKEYSTILAAIGLIIVFLPLGYNQLIIREIFYNKNFEEELKDNYIYNGSRVSLYILVLTIIFTILFPSSYRGVIIILCAGCESLFINTCVLYIGNKNYNLLIKKLFIRTIFYLLFIILINLFSGNNSFFYNILLIIAFYNLDYYRYISKQFILLVKKRIYPKIFIRKENISLLIYSTIMLSFPLLSRLIFAGNSSNSIFSLNIKIQSLMYIPLLLFSGKIIFNSLPEYVFKISIKKVLIKVFTLSSLWGFLIIILSDFLLINKTSFYIYYVVFFSFSTTLMQIYPIYISRYVISKQTKKLIIIPAIALASSITILFLFLNIDTLANYSYATACLSFSSIFFILLKKFSPKS